jgi:hypothetical protein
MVGVKARFSKWWCGMLNQHLCRWQRWCSRTWSDISFVLNVLLPVLLGRGHHKLEWLNIIMITILRALTPLRQFIEHSVLSHMHPACVWIIGSACLAPFLIIDEHHLGAAVI